MVPFVFALATKLEPCSVLLCHNGVINNVETEREIQMEGREREGRERGVRKGLPTQSRLKVDVKPMLMAKRIFRPDIRQSAFLQVTKHEAHHTAFYRGFGGHK